MEWVVKNGEIIGFDGKTTLCPTANEIFAATSEITINGISYPFALSGLKLFKLLPLSVELHFSIVDGNIKYSLFALKAHQKYPIDLKLGYLIIDSAWHYLDSCFEVIKQIFSDNNLDSSPFLDYFQYIEVTNQLREANIVFNDEVYFELEKIKDNASDTNADYLNSVLFPYQKSGINWLNFMSKGNCGCILGDEMGLGKTLQIIGLLVSQKKADNSKKYVVVSPVSLLANWYREIEKFAPSISAYIHYGSNRTGFYTKLLEYDVIITSYTTIQSDMSMFNMIVWDMLIIDEAQNIKNPHSKRRNVLNNLNRRMTIAVTGTPFENHITDVWSISDFVIPGHLGSLRNYENKFEDNLISAKEIEKSLSPIMLRRKVAEVANDLPEKIEISQPILMTEDEAQYYESERNQYDGKDALNQVRIDLIQGLRMFCSHPKVYRDDLENIDPIKISNKYQRTCEIIEECKTYGDKILIFTSFNKMIDIFCEDLPNRFGIPVKYINGSIDSLERQKIIDDFSLIKGSAILILNPKAAGAGLNITCANRVIHYTLEWNPAVESQATARAYRRGQEQTVFVYRLYYAGTIEEFVNEKIENKQILFDTVVVGNKGATNSAELVKALSYSPRKEQANEKGN